MISSRINFSVKITFTLLLILFSIISPVSALESNSIDENYRNYIIKDFYFAVNFDNKNNKMELIFPDGNSKILERKISASGARYADNNMTFWNKGERVQLFIDDQLILEAERTEVNSKSLKKFSDKAKIEEAVFFKSRDSYLMFNKMLDRSEFILNGNELIINEDSGADSGDTYCGENIKIIELNDGLLIIVGQFELFAEPVNMSDYIANKNLSLKGLGQEPGWMMKISSEMIELELDYGQVTLSINPSYFSLKEGQDKIKYDVMTSLVDFQIEIKNEAHQDIMSGKLFPYTVKITGGKINLIGGAYISN